MADYGHDLLFGSFITPTNQQPETVVALAQLSERVGLDLITFQDHPYQPRFLDTWTLMSYVAAATSAIHIAPNVLNLPLRPPAVVARAAASLDILSGGRFDLGLGAGAFWDAIVAMGARRLSPGQAVDALDEAIAVMRAMWDGDTPGGVRVDGTYYRVMGAKKGPSPAHEIPIWIGAYKPRMLRLTGRVADGWLPSMPYMEAGQLAESNRIIDAAADEAGRPPRAIRRLLNINGSFGSANRGFLDGPVSQWVEQLTDLSLADGMSGYILSGDDPDTIRRFAEEVAPTVRDMVTKARTAPSPERSTSRPDDTRRQSSTAHAATTSADSIGAFTVAPTPDDGARLGDAHPWDESTRPVGPERDPNRSYTGPELAAAQHLIDVHDQFRAELTQVRDLMDEVLEGSVQPHVARSDLNTMTIRQNNWTLGTYCQTYCRIVTTHHTLEDQAMFPGLRHADPRLAPVVDRLEEEHVIIQEVLERVDEALIAFVSTPDGATRLREAVDLLTDTLLSHFAYEERELIEPIARFALV